MKKNAKPLQLIEQTAKQYGATSTQNLASLSALGPQFPSECTVLCLSLVHRQFTTGSECPKIGFTRSMHFSPTPWKWDHILQKVKIFVS